MATVDEREMSAGGSGGDGTHSGSVVAQSSVSGPALSQPGNQPPVPLTEDGKCPTGRSECYNHNLDANGRLRPGTKFYSKRETTPDGLHYIVVRVSDCEEFPVAYNRKGSVGAAIQDAVTNKRRLGQPRGKVNSAQKDIADARALGRAQDKKLAAAAAKLSSADVEMGGTGKTPSAQPPSTTSVECAICTDEDSPVTPGSRDSITSTCGHTFHASCFARWIVKNPNCPLCRKTFAPAPVAADDESDDDAASDDIVCNVCGDGTDGDNNPILMCSGPHPTQTGQCAVAMHMKCLDRPPASCIGVNCWCSQHWKLASRGDIKLAATAGTSLACTTAIDRAARGPPLRAGASASTLAPAAAKGKKPGSSIAKKKQMRRAVPKKGLPTSEQLVSKPIAKKRNGGIRITARVASCAKSLREQNNKENIIGLAQDLGIATVRCFHAPGGKRMMYDAPLQWIAVRLAEKLTGE